MKGDTGLHTVAGNGQLTLTTGPANYLHAYEAEGLFLVQLLLDRKVVDHHIFDRLTTLNDREFDEIRLTDLTGSNNDIRLFYGSGHYTANDRNEVTLAQTADVNIVSGNVTVNNAQPNTIVPLADGSVGSTAAQLVAADADSLYVVIKVPSSAARGIRIGDSTVTTTKGHLIEPGETATVQVQNAAIWAVREAAAVTNVAVTLTRFDKV